MYAPLGVQYGLSKISGHRYGLSQALQWQLGDHFLEAGAWVEKDVFNRLQARYNLTDGSPAGQPLLDQPVHLQGDFTSTRDSLQLDLKDTWSLLDDRLRLQYGFKRLDLDYEMAGYRNAGDYIAGRQPRLSTSWNDDFLPQAGLVYDLDGRSQLFASYSENMALPRAPTMSTEPPARMSRHRKPSGRRTTKSGIASIDRP